MDLGLSRMTRRSADLAVVGQGVSANEGRPASGGHPRPLSRASRAESMGSLTSRSQHGSFSATYDSNVHPSELRNQNLYIQSLQHRQPQVVQKLIGPGNSIIALLTLLTYSLVRILLCLHCIKIIMAVVKDDMLEEEA